LFSLFLLNDFCFEQDTPSHHSVQKKFKPMQNFTKSRLFIVAFTVHFTLFISACETSNSTYSSDNSEAEMTYSNQSANAEQVYAIPYNDTKSFLSKKSDTYNAISSSLQKLGFVLTMSDFNGGVISAEKSIQSLDPEQALPYDPNEIANESNNINVKSSDNDDVGKAILIILSIVLIVGIIFIIAGAASSNSSSNRQSNNRNDDCPPERHHEDNHRSSAPETVTSFKYITSFSISENNMVSTVKMNLTRTTIQNGSPISTESIKNSKFNSRVFKSIEKEIGSQSSSQ
jgi:hypothetical protein